jgi:diketogulonate reductase-like aldo/keto reductase
MKAGVAVPEFIYGTAWKEERTAELTELALRSGFRAIDTANQRRHYFEAGVGEGIKAACGARVVKRAELFIQTKFTYVSGQDHRLPYDPDAPVAEQVRQSLASSLAHLGTDYLDSFILHGPASGFGWTATDDEAWSAMQREQESGRTRAIGLSNVSLAHLDQMMATHNEAPAFVQNRCFARFGWDREVRGFCREHGITYQGFSLLTANLEVLRHPLVARLAQHFGISHAQVIFAFARSIGILPLTGTSDEQHMRGDLASLALKLPEEAVAELENGFA